MLAVQQAIKKLSVRENLPDELAREAMLEIMEGRATKAQIAGMLVGLHVKGETVSELVAIAKTMMEKAVKVDSGENELLDTCGTGGDGSRTFNISTAVAFVCAACGVKVAKHGNRSVSSVSGSADVLAALGARVDLSPEEAVRVLEKTGITFLFAPLYHPGMKHAAAVRKELSTRTVFNLIGPVVNPAGASYRFMGVSSQSYARKIARAMRELGIRKAVIFSAEDGLDEISLEAPTFLIHLDGNRMREFVIRPADLRMPVTPVDRIRVSSPEESARLITGVFRGEKDAARNYVIANAAVALYASGRASSITGGVEQARQAVDSGAALEKLSEFVSATGGKLELS